jgi:hypothetical protein
MQKQLLWMAMYFLVMFRHKKIIMIIVIQTRKLFFMNFTSFGILQDLG